MKAFKGYALIRKSQMRRKGESLQIASLDAAIADWQFTFVDPTQGDELVDPATARMVDKVSYTEYGGVEKLAEGHDAVISFESQYPYNGMVITTPTGLRIEQAGAPVPTVIGGVELPEWTVFFNVVTSNL